MSGAGGARQGILSLAIKDKSALYNAYMPYVKGGGIFVPTAKRYMLGDEVFILLTLMEDKDRLPVAGKVRVLPVHACMTAAAYGKYYVVDGDEVIDQWDRVNGW